MNTTKKETEAVILEYHDNGITRSEIAQILKISKRYVDAAIRKREHELRLVAEFGRDWERATAKLRYKMRKQKKAQEEVREGDDGVVYCRVSSGAGYWWKSGYRFSGANGREQARG